MKNKHSFIGSSVALITPMFDDGVVDYDALNQLIDFHIDAGTTAIVSVGTTGESATVGVKEHLKSLTILLNMHRKGFQLLLVQVLILHLKQLILLRKLNGLVLMPVY